jgi:hypothetical protein
VGDAASVSLSLGSGELSDSEGSGVGVSDGVSVGLSVGVSDGVSLGGSEVRLGSESEGDGSEIDGVGSVGRSLGSVMLPLPQPVTSARNSAEPPAATTSLDLTTTTPSPTGGSPPQRNLSTPGALGPEIEPSRDLGGGVARPRVVGWAAYDEEVA